MMKRFLILLLTLALCMGLTVSGAASAAAGIVMDDADLLSQAEEQALTRKLTEIGTANEAQMIVATVASAQGKDPDDLVNEVYDAMGFGFGPLRDGVLLLVCMDPREYRILSNGYAGNAIDPGVIDTIGDAIVSDLSDGDYADAFDIFADKCGYYLNGYLNGFPFKTGGNLVIALVVGLVLALIVTSVLKGQLKSVRKQDQANSYVRSGSMQVTLSRDIYLYRHVSRTKRESSNSSGSRSGGSRSVGGGSF